MTSQSGDGDDGGAHEWTPRHSHGVQLTGTAAPRDGAAPVPTHGSPTSVKLGAISPEHCCTLGRPHLRPLASPCSQAPVRSHLEPTHPAGGGVGGGVTGWFKKKSRKKSIEVFQTGRLNQSGHEPEENIEKQAHLQKPQEGRLGGGRTVPLGQRTAAHLAKEWKTLDPTADRAQPGGRAQDTLKDVKPKVSVGPYPTLHAPDTEISCLRN